MDNLHDKIQQWASEYQTIGGGTVPPGFVKFIATRLVESGLIPDSKDWITIYRDGKTERVRITSQEGHVVTYQREDGSSCATTVGVMKKWCEGKKLASAVDYSRVGESGPMNEALDRLRQELGGEFGMGSVSLDEIKTDD